MFEMYELVIYINGDRAEIGKIKSDAGDGKYFVWYHSGETAAKTDEKHLKSIDNYSCVLKDNLGRGY